MKFLLNNGRILDKEELWCLYCAISKTAKRIDFEFWLTEEIEAGIIKVVEV